MDVAPASLGGIVAWYSLIHTPQERLAAVFDSFSEALAPGGFLQLAFQVGDTKRHIQRAYGHEVSMHAYLMAPDVVERQLADAGFAVEARLVREPDADEQAPQAYLIGRKK